MPYTIHEYRLSRLTSGLRQNGGLGQVHAAAAHGLFTGGPEILESPVFDQLVITDTVPPFRLPPELVSRRLTVLDSSAIVAAALKSEYG